MKSVCFFTFDLGTGGTEKVVIYLANYLVTKGRDVTLLTVFDKNDLEHLISPKVKIACLHKNKIRNAIPALIKFIRTHEIDNFISSILDRFPEIKTDVMVEEIAEYLEARDREYYTRNNQFKVDYELSLSRTGGY